MNATDLLDALPAAVYATDAAGIITYYNDAAATLWGVRPELGTTAWCGSWRLYWPDGRPMAHDECPMAVALRENRKVRGVEGVLERPDGTRIAFLPFPTPLRDEAGRLTGAVNLLVDIGERKRADIDSAMLAAIVASSEDAIISKTLQGRITSWNTGAARIFGYSAEEAVGRPITMLIPPELIAEEETILAKLQRGERIEHYETERVTKDGRRINISLTVSPVRDRSGNIIGASKVARDVTERKQAEALQRLLFDELNHRVKNMLATIQAIASQSLRRAASPAEFVAAFDGRVQALARAHQLLVDTKMKGAAVMDIVREQVLLGSSQDPRIGCSGPRVVLDARTTMQLALVLHELATNARKYGALATPAGRLSIGWRLQLGTGRELRLHWKESGVAHLNAPSVRGFGTTLIERSLQANNGEALISYDGDGLRCEIRLPLVEGTMPLGAPAAPAESAAVEARRERPFDLSGRRVLVIEDEPLIAMEVEAMLASAHCATVGPAGTSAMARKLIETAAFDAALIDANLAGEPVDELAALLTRKGRPFAFATGYGRQALPKGFGDAPLLAKPFGCDELLATVEGLLRGAESGGAVVALKSRRD